MPKVKAYTKQEIEQLKEQYLCSRFSRLQYEPMHDRKQIGEPFPFFSLPTELRLQVYKHVLIQPRPIELWPHGLDNTFKECQELRKETIYTYARTTQCTLTLLRVCKRIHAEASQTFYGDNEFRFTGINGWMVCRAWLHTIGHFNASFITDISLHVPFPGVDYLLFPKDDNQLRGELIHFYRGRLWYSFKKQVEGFGLRIPPKWGYDACVREVVDVLARSNVKVVRMVLPGTYYVNHRLDPSPMNTPGFYWNILRKLKERVDRDRERKGMTGMRLGFLLLKNRFQRDIPTVFLWTKPWLKSYTGECKRLLKEIEGRNWISGVEYGVQDWTIGYRVVSKEECEFLVGKEAMIRDERVEEWWLGTTE
ncbi:hypothetical protein BS50DRAFT_635938 [Corynespora cassiicola Philippines]|uniref:2EXR domain-containing protein n=1 Tax=Corynespora cassiicola Philippines TaxID=1448308 RepID=A0A2T2NIP0_CORCC|nr:hypothetical protein BS50DRAFT_635938 [Corynespora cassiicola Philippines]